MKRSCATLHDELVKLQQWVIKEGLKVCIIFEGRDSAGKGGVIKAITERVSPRVFRVVALPAPTEREKSQMYFQRYVRHLPSAGEIVIFDRSWYNRAGVERVMGFYDEAQVETFLKNVPLVERSLVDSGIILLKYWLEVSEEEQTKRLESRIDDGRKTWKLSPMDLKSYSRWYDYSRARDDMFVATDTGYAPWYVARTDDKRRGRLNIITAPAETRSVQRHRARQDRTAETAESGRLQGARLSVQVDRREILTRHWSATGGDNQPTCGNGYAEVTVTCRASSMRMPNVSAPDGSVDGGTDDIDRTRRGTRHSHRTARAAGRLVLRHHSTLHRHHRLGGCDVGGAVSDIRSFTNVVGGPHEVGGRVA